MNTPEVKDRLLNMKEAGTLLGVSGRRLRDTLKLAHAERGDVLTQIHGFYFITESTLRNLFPQIFSNTKSKVDDRFDAMLQRLDLLESKLNETRQQLYQSRTRIRTLEERMKPGRAPRGDE